MFKLAREESFGQRLTRALIYRDMTPHELAVAMNVTDGTISQYRKTDGSDPKIERVAKIAEILQVNPVWLLGFSGVDPDYPPCFRKATQEDVDVINGYISADDKTKDNICAILGVKRANIGSRLSKAVGHED